MSDIIAKICFDKTDFNLYLFLLIIFIIYLLYIIHINNVIYIQNLSKITQPQNKEIQIKEIKQEQIPVKNISESNQDIKSRFLDKLYNPLSPPENIIESGTFYTPRYDAYINYQNIGYLTGNGTQYSVFGRWMYPNKSDKWQYYLINNTRSRLKIPFKTKNNNELYDGDTIDIPELGNGFIFKKYENEGMRYNPNVF
jgi:hypothetical protein